MSRYKAYSSYKETRHSWLESVPTHWKMLPLKFLTAQHVTDGPHETPEFIDEGVPFLSVDGIQNNQLVFEGCRYISREDHARYSIKCKPNQGDVLLGKAASVGKVAHVDTGIEFNVWSPLAVIRPRSKKTGRFIYYSLQSALLQMQCDMYSNANTQKNLGMSTIDNLAFACPTDDEAEQVANFLDHETAKIDALIEKQQRLIDLLKEKRQAVISHAVTKGLSPNAPMKDSGVEWLGEVPAHWEVKCIRHVIDAIGDVDHFMPPSVEKGVPYLMTGDLKDCISEVSLDDCKQVSHSDYKELSKRIKTSKGDVVMARYATIGTLMYVDVDVEMLVSYSCVTLKTNQSKMIGRYLFQYMKSDAFRQGVEHRINTNTQGNVGIKDLQGVNVAVPPSDEQAAIAAFLALENLKMDALNDKAESAIALLKERRTALISAAVTGKIDVRDWQAAA
jgi:type I restriction enzyme, S subunit